MIGASRDHAWEDLLMLQWVESSFASISQAYLLFTRDVNKNLTPKDQDKDKDLTPKHQDKDLTPKDLDKDHG